MFQKYERSDIDAVFTSEETSEGRDTTSHDGAAWPRGDPPDHRLVGVTATPRDARDSRESRESLDSLGHVGPRAPTHHRHSGHAQPDGQRDHDQFGQRG